MRSEFKMRGWMTHIGRWFSRAGADPTMTCQQSSASFLVCMKSGRVGMRVASSIIHVRGSAELSCR